MQLNCAYPQLIGALYDRYIYSNSAQTFWIYLYSDIVADIVTVFIIFVLSTLIIV